MLLVGQSIMGYTLPEVLVASNANVGGPATAGALASGEEGVLHPCIVLTHIFVVG